MPINVLEARFSLALSQQCDYKQTGCVLHSGDLTNGRVRF
jgi:hypothetical protein